MVTGGKMLVKWSLRPRPRHSVNDGWLSKQGTPEVKLYGPN